MCSSDNRHGPEDPLPPIRDLEAFPVGTAFRHRDFDINVITAEEHRRLVTNFCGAHAHSIETAVVLMRETDQDPHRIKVSADAIRFNLAYRADHGGNPAKFFTVQSVEVVPMDAAQRHMNLTAQGEFGRQRRRSKRLEGYFALQYVIFADDITPAGDGPHAPYAEFLPLRRMPEERDAALRELGNPAKDGEQKYTHLP